MSTSDKQNEYNEFGDSSDDLADEYGQLKEPIDLPRKASAPPKDLKKTVHPDARTSKLTDLPPRFVPAEKPKTREEQPAIPPNTPQSPPAADKPAAWQSPELIRKHPWLAFLAVVAAVLILAGTSLALLTKNSGTANAIPTASPPTAQATAVPAAAQSIPTPSVTATTAPTAITVDNVYITAVRAKTAQDWQKAAELFQQIYEKDPSYLDVQQQLAEALTQWGKALTQQGDIDQALEKLKLAAQLTSSSEASDLITQLLLYEAGDKALEQKDWMAAIDNLEKLRDSQPDFLNSTDLLYQAYIGYSESLKQQHQNDKALEACNNALALKAGDQPAQSCVAGLSPIVFSARLFDNPIDSSVACGTSFESTIFGVVKDRQGKGIRGATVQVRASNGSYKQTRTTNSQGGFNVPGLGCTRWVVTLIGIPDEIAPGGFRPNSFQVDLNGGRYSAAGIEFRQKER